MKLTPQREWKFDKSSMKVLHFCGRKVNFDIS